MRPAVPIYKGTHPYEEIAYGYALSKNSVITSALFGLDFNPMDKLGPALTDDLGETNTILCFGQSFLLKNILPKNIDIFDLKNVILEDSDFYTELKDKSELERLRLIFDL